MNLKDAYTDGQAELVKSVVASEKKLADAEHHIEEFEHSKDASSASDTRPGVATGRL